MKKLLVLIFIVSFAFRLAAQSSDNHYRMPLKDALKKIEQKFDVRISYMPEQVDGVELDYAPWRIRGDVYECLSGVLSPLGLGWYNSYGTNKFKVTDFQYYRWSVSQGAEFLTELEAQTPDLQSWEARKIELRKHLTSALRIDSLTLPRPKAMLGQWRRHDGYKAANISLEVLPGFYVCGTIYEPSSRKGKLPVVLCPNGHWAGGRYREDHQRRCAALARMGAVAVSYDLFAWGEGVLQFDVADHRRSMSMTFQTLASLRYIDYLSDLPEADKTQIAVTGGSGAGSHTVLLAAIDSRVTVSAPVVSLACHFFGGCPCESGMPVHVKDGQMFTSNVEIAAMAAPRPMLVVSDGHDWTYMTPQIEFPYLRRMYALYGMPEQVSNAHFPDERHDYGISKRTAVYRFMAEHLGLNLSAVQNTEGEIDESFCTIEPVEAMLSFGPEGKNLPPNAIRGFDNLVETFDSLTTPKQ